MTDIADIVQVTVNVQEARLTRAGFGVPLIFAPAESTVFATRVKEYPTLTDLAVDFSSTTKVYKTAQALFSQSQSPTRVKVGRRETGDASHTTALDAIVAEDPDWYCLLTTYKGSSDITELAAWTEAKTKIFLASSEDADVLTAVSTDVASLLQASNYNRTGYLWHHQAGVDATGVSYTVSSGVATITSTAHGLKVGDPITFSNSSGQSIDGNNTVASVAGPNTFTVTTTAANEAGPATVNYFARYTFPEAAWAGLQLSTDPGSSTWKFKALSGIIPAPLTAMTPSEEATALGKNANLYRNIAGAGATLEGVLASGRFIDIQRGIDWLEARLGEAIAERLLQEPKIPYTDVGGAILQGEIAAVLDLGVTRNVLGPLLDDSGDFYRISVPKVADQAQADRSARYFPGIAVEAQLAGAVHSLAITVNAQV